MRYAILATDFDGTLTQTEQIRPEVLEALRAVAASGRKLVLVTGRMLDDLLRVFPESGLFDRIVAENGGILYAPTTRTTRRLADSPPARLVEELRRRGVDPLAVGQVILASWRPYEWAAIEAIRDMDLEYHVEFNRDAVMIMPPTVTKLLGFQQALEDLGLSRHNAVGLGDAQNDEAFLQSCERSVAVANAVPAVKELADFVTEGPAGEGIVEICRQLQSDDLRSIETRSTRNRILLGRSGSTGSAWVTPQRDRILIAGPSGSGKSRAILGLVERLVDEDYQIVLVDPEGDYSGCTGMLSLGDGATVPTASEIGQALDFPSASVLARLVGLPMNYRPAFLDSIVTRLDPLQATVGRPHCVMLDEAHHMLPDVPATAAHPFVAHPPDGFILATVYPSDIHPAALALVDTVLALGPNPDETLASFCRAIGAQSPDLPADRPPTNAMLWTRATGQGPLPISVVPSRTAHRRHERKYVEGDLGLVKSFYFRESDDGPAVRAANLVQFVQLAPLVNDATWLRHLRRGDYSRWIGNVLADRDTASEVRRIELLPEISAQASRQCVGEILRRHYVLPDG
jgi:hydroxymethylpyrimidine pyrophosphatase-like HAD family hydrolase